MMGEPLKKFGQRSFVGNGRRLNVVVDGLILGPLIGAAVWELVVYPGQALFSLYFLPVVIAALLVPPLLVALTAATVGGFCAFDLLVTNSPLSLGLINFLALLAVIAVSLAYSAWRRVTGYQGKWQRAMLVTADTLARSGALDPLADTVVEQIRLCTGAAQVAFWRVDPEQSEFRLLAHRGVGSPDPSDVRQLVYSGSDGSAQRAGVTRALEISRTRENGTDPNLGPIQSPGRSDTSVTLVQPLVVAGRIVGALSFTRPGRRSISTRERALAQVLADLSATAVERDRLEAAIARPSQDLAEAHQKFARILEGVPFGIVVQDPRGQIVYANTIAAQMLGATHPELLRTSTHSSLAQHLALSRVTNVPWLLPDRLSPPELPPGEATQVTVSSRDAVSGDERWLSLYAAASTDAANRIEFLITTIHDVTELKRAEAERTRVIAREQAASRARDDLLANVAHELKTPITSLGGFAQLELSRLERVDSVDPERIRRALQIIHRQSQKMASQVSHLIDISLLDSGRLILDRSVVDLAELVEDEVMAARLRAVFHTFELDAPEVVLGLVDPAQIEQVVVNLLDNAVKYSPEGGEIVVEVLARDSTSVEISVRDHGIGIPVEHRARIFDRFYRAHPDLHYGGMGIGLYLSQQIVRMHGGDLTVDFPADGGSRFVVSLPISQPASGAVS